MRYHVPGAALAAFLVASFGLSTSWAQTCSHPAGNVDFEVYGDINGSGSANIADVLCLVLGVLAEQAGDPLSGVGCISGDPVRTDLSCDATTDLVDAVAAISIAIGAGTPSGLSPDANGCPSACTPCAPMGGSSCLIGGSCVPEGDRMGTDGCQVCDPGLNPTDWSVESPVTYYLDVDDDTFGVDGDTISSCIGQGDHTALMGGDCNDGSNQAYPGFSEICGDSLDNDCLNGVDDGCAGASDGVSCQSIIDATPGSASGIYAIDPDGPGGNDPFGAYCDFGTTGEGWTLALRAQSGSQFTFYSPFWTNGQLLNEAVSPGDPSANTDSLFPAFLDQPGTEIRACFTNPSGGAVTCMDYTLPSEATLGELFANTPVGSDTLGTGALIFSSSSSEATQWLSSMGLTLSVFGNSSTTYTRTAINLDDDSSTFDARVRFGVCINNEPDVNTLNYCMGFGASAYFNSSSTHNTSDPPWSTGAGVTTDQGSGFVHRQGTLWIRPASVPFQSCREILSANPAAASGTYTVDIDGPDQPLPPTQVYCDMTAGITFQPQGTVDNNTASILGGCANGFAPFEAKSVVHIDALERYVTGLGSDGNAWYYANVFAGPDAACPTPDNEFGWLTDASTWNDSFTPSAGYLNMSGNCNAGVFDPVPLNQADGFATRSGSTVLFSTPEVLQSGTVVCSLNLLPAAITSCDDHLTANPGAPTAQYPLDPDGAGSGTPFATYCEMDMMGGGWTLTALQVPTAVWPSVTESDIGSGNFGYLNDSWRYGNTKIQSITPTETWLIQSTNATSGAVIDNAYFMPSCVVDWDKNVGAFDGGTVDPACGTGYTNSSFASILGGNAVANNSSLGIGMNNNGVYCSIRMANDPDAFPNFGAFGCTLEQGTVRMWLWAR